MWQTGLAAQVFLPLQISSQTFDSFSGCAEERKRNNQCWFLGKSLSYTSKIITVKKLKAGHLNFLPPIIICKLWQSQKWNQGTETSNMSLLVSFFFFWTMNLEENKLFLTGWCSSMMHSCKNPILSDRASLWSNHMIWIGAGTDSSEQPHSFIWGVTSWIRMDQNEDDPSLRVETPRWHESRRLLRQADNFYRTWWSHQVSTRWEFPVKQNIWNNSTTNTHLQ